MGKQQLSATRDTQLETLRGLYNTARNYPCPSWPILNRISRLIALIEMDFDTLTTSNMHIDNLRHIALGYQRELRAYCSEYERQKRRKIPIKRIPEERPLEMNHDFKKGAVIKHINQSI